MNERELKSKPYEQCDHELIVDGRIHYCFDIPDHYPLNQQTYFIEEGIIEGAFARKDELLREALTWFDVENYAEAAINYDLIERIRKELEIK